MLWDERRGVWEPGHPKASFLNHHRPGRSWEAQIPGRSTARLLYFLSGPRGVAKPDAPDWGHVISSWGGGSVSPIPGKLQLPFVNVCGLVGQTLPLGSWKGTLGNWLLLRARETRGEKGLTLHSLCHVIAVVCIKKRRETPELWGAGQRERGSPVNKGGGRL